MYFCLCEGKCCAEYTSEDIYLLALQKLNHVSDTTRQRCFCVAAVRRRQCDTWIRSVSGNNNIFAADRRVFVLWRFLRDFCRYLGNFFFAVETQRNVRRGKTRERSLISLHD